jgi:sugar phosphate isomerase/epimerase
MRYAICNETFEGWDHRRVCETAARLGYTGLEVAPFTLANRITDVSRERRQELRKQAEDANLQICGLHWLLAKTEGFHLTTDDRATRDRTAEYLGELARCCRDLGGDLMVFGSPMQRNRPEGMSREQALRNAAETFRAVLPALTDNQVRICLEPLTSAETNFMMTCAEGAELMDMLNHPLIQLHLDVKAMSSDQEAPVPELIRKYGRRMGHFHANDPNKRGPGFGAVDFVPIFKALADIQYQGWLSVEVFDYTPDPETIGRESIRYMKECVEKLGGV